MRRRPCRRRRRRSTSTSPLLHTNQPIPIDIHPPAFSLLFLFLFFYFCFRHGRPDEPAIFLPILQYPLTHHPPLPRNSSVHPTPSVPPSSVLRPSISPSSIHLTYPSDTHPTLPVIRSMGSRRTTRRRTRPFSVNHHPTTGFRTISPPHHHLL